MGSTCNTVKEEEYRQKYYFNEIDNQNESGIETAPINPGNVQMEEVVSLSIQIKNVDISSEHRVELIAKENNNGIFYNKSVGTTEKKVRNSSDNTIIFDKFFQFLIILKNNNY